MGLLHRGGAQLTPRAEDADILVVNTCSFIDSAKQESVDTILEMVQHKIGNGGRAQRLIVAGCLVERYRDEIIKNIPEVDAVVGTGELEAILEAAGLNQPASNSPFPILTSAQIDRHASSVNQHSRPEGGAQTQHELGAPGLASETWVEATTTSRPEGDLREQQGRFSRDAWDGATAALPSYLYSDETPRILSTPRASAYIKIAEGCDHPCSFCIIPQLRGKFRSRPIASIVVEAQSLIAQGVREITLIGQDTTCYGEDLPPQLLSTTHTVSSRPTNGSGETLVFGAPTETLRRPELADLLDALAPLPGLKWLRFLYAYPNKITTRLLESIARHDTVAKYLDVPLQHASASVLRRMKRGGSGDRFLQIIAKARQIVPNLVLRTSFIVGFPGETEDDFETLCAFVTSSESSTGSASSATPTKKAPEPSTSTRRSPSAPSSPAASKLMKLQQKISAQAHAVQWIGRRRSTSSSKASPKRPNSSGRAAPSTMAPEIDGKVLINDFGPHEELVPGTFYRAEITESHDYDVVARIIE